MSEVDTSPSCPGAPGSPGSPESAEAAEQRRNFVRVTTPVDGLPKWALFAEDLSTHQWIDLPGTPCNLSGGGVGVLVQVTPQTQTLLPVRRRYRCTFQIPTTQEQVNLSLRLVRASPGARKMIYLGLAFVFDDPAERRRIEDALAIFCADLQREQIRRLRGMQNRSG